MKNTWKLISILSLIIIFLIGFTKEKLQTDTEVKEITYKKISAEEAKEIIDNSSDYILLDVREENEFAEGHIEGAILIPYGEISDRAEEELPDKEKTILVYCRSGRRSSIAAEQLVELGYTDVQDFGGIIDWTYEIVK